jgi:hypothetical protein
MEQIKKGFKPPFFRNKSQTYHEGKYAQNEPRMIDSFGKGPRQQPIKCWGFEGDQLYRDFPHKGERMRIVHNI